MKVAYFDCSSGVSGDMILASFLDAGLDFAFLKKELLKLRLSGYELKKKRVNKNGFAATKFDVILKGALGRHKRKTLKEIKNIIAKSRLSASVKALSIKIFENIAAAEAKAHGRPKDKVHFHEIGDTDSLIDIVGAAIAFDYFKIGEVCASAINVGSGIVNTAHGALPVPAPATAELLKGVPVFSGEDRYELTTPTGAAVLRSVAKSFGSMPLIKIATVGTGAGSFSTHAQPNLLRLFLGEARGAGNDYDKDSAIVVEANIDDMNLIGTGHIMEELFSAGALDVYFTPVYTKKSRMAILLSVITGRSLLNDVIDKIFEETTTFGVRAYEVSRFKLHKFVKSVKTEYGYVKVKIGKVGNKTISASPEYESCKSAAKDRKVPFRRVYQRSNFT